MQVANVANGLASRMFGLKWPWPRSPLASRLTCCPRLPYIPNTKWISDFFGSIHYTKQFGWPGSQRLSSSVIISSPLIRCSRNSAILSDSGSRPDNPEITTSAVMSFISSKSACSGISPITFHLTWKHINYEFNAQWKTVCRNLLLSEHFTQGYTCQSHSALYLIKSCPALAMASCNKVFLQKQATNIIVDLSLS